MTGFTGRFLRIDLDTGAITLWEPDAALYRDYLGGSALAARLYADMVGEGEPPQPLDPANPLVFVNGPLTGSFFPGSGRFSVAARSPLTGLWGECNCGGAFGPALKLAGYDGIILTGAAAKPVFLFIEGETVELRDASTLWGSDTYETHARLDTELAAGKGPLRTMQIGPAGENRVALANIVNEMGSVAGRCGLGAVMGSKNLKAIAVRGAGGKMQYADVDAAKTVRDRVVERLKGSILAVTLHEMGTLGALDSGMFSGDVPVRNWSLGEWEESLETLGAFYLNDHLLAKVVGCYACTVRCKRVVEVKEGPYAIPEAAGPEYETVCMMGTNLLNPSLEAVVALNDLCNRLGMDTIGMGGVLAVLMEAQERGLLDPDEVGLDFSWGNMEAALDAARWTASGAGFGAHMAAGSRSLAAHLGAPDLAVHVRGLDLPAHDPRGFHGYGLAYIASARGACHLQSANLMAEGGMASWPEIDLKGPFKGTTSKGKAELTWKCIAVGNLFNALCMCEFIGAFIPLTEQVDMLETATGLGLSLDDLMEMGWRAWRLKRELLARMGSGSEDDVLPPKVLTPTSEGANAGSLPDIERLKREFAEISGVEL